VVRPWLGALALAVCALIWLAVFAWSVGFEPAAVVSGLAQGAATVRLEGIGMALHIEAAEMHREAVARLRRAGAGEARLRSARWRIAGELRAAALLAQAGGDLKLAQSLLTRALQAAPERVDLRCMLTELRARGMPPGDRRMELLRLAYRTDAACAHLLVGESFLETADLQAAEAYLTRAARAEPQWARAHLTLARLYRRSGRREDALAEARAALACADGLRERIVATEMVRLTGGTAPAAWRVIAEHLWHGYRHVGVLVLALVLFAVHPAIVALLRRAVARLRRQESMPESAS